MKIFGDKRGKLVSLEGNKTEETQDMVLDLFEKEEVEEATYNYFLD